MPDSPAYATCEPGVSLVRGTRGNVRSTHVSSRDATWVESQGVYRPCSCDLPLPAAHVASGLTTGRHSDGGAAGARCTGWRPDAIWERHPRRGVVVRAPHACSPSRARERGEGGRGGRARAHTLGVGMWPVGAPTHWTRGPRDRWGLGGNRPRGRPSRWGTRYGRPPHTGRVGWCAVRMLDVPSRSAAKRDVGAPSKRAPAAYVSWRGGKGEGGEGEGRACWRDAGGPGLAVEPHLYRVPTRLVFCPPRRRSARRLRRGRRRLRAAARLSPPRLWVGVGEGEPMSAVADSRGETPSRWSSCLEGGGGGRSRGLHRRAPRCDVVAWGSGLVREGKRGEEGLPSPFSHPFCRRSPSGRRHRPRPGRTTRRWRLATHQALRTTLAGRSCRLAGSAPSRP